MSHWKVLVLEKGKDWVDFEVKVNHWDSGSFPDQKLFAFSLVAFESIKFSVKALGLASNSILGDELDVARFLDTKYMTSVMDNYIKGYVVYEAKNTANRFDDSSGADWDEYLANADRLPVMKVRVWVTDPNWMDHRKVGEEFDSILDQDFGGPHIMSDIKLPVSEIHHG